MSPLPDLSAGAPATVRPIPPDHLRIPASIGRFRYPVLGTDTDFRDRIQLSALFSICQEVASLQAQAAGLGADRLDSRRMRWLLLRLSVRMLRLPLWRETLVIDSWPRGYDRLLSLRDFYLSDGDGKPLGGATTSWVLVDADTHRPVRRNGLGPEFDIATESGTLGFDAPRLPDTPIPEGASPDLVRTARFSDIDRNGHLNNTRYIAWSVDALHVRAAAESAPAPEHAGSDRLLDLPVLGADVQYLSEVRPGESLALHVLPWPGDPGARAVESRKSDGTPAFRARLLLVQ